MGGLGPLLVCGHHAGFSERMRPSSEKWCYECKRWVEEGAAEHVDLDVGQALAIANRLAESRPPVAETSWGGVCMLCSGTERQGNVEHDPTCPWRMAQEWRQEAPRAR